MKLFYITLMGLFPFVSYTQTVTRQPEKVIRYDVQSKIEGELVISEGNRTTTIHPDGSRTITVDATQVIPANYSAESSQEPEILISALNWTKEDLELYIASLENKKSYVLNNPEEHAKALDSGWYEFIDEMIQQSKEQLSKMN
jgi:hypothetical protein